MQIVAVQPAIAPNTNGLAVNHAGLGPPALTAVVTATTAGDVGIAITGGTTGVGCGLAVGLVGVAGLDIF
jgi:hypothetical protein